MHVLAKEFRLHVLNQERKLPSQKVVPCRMQFGASQPPLRRRQRNVKVLPKTFKVITNQDLPEDREKRLQQLVLPAQFEDIGR